MDKSFSSVQYFVYHYPEVFPAMGNDRLNEQLLKYQLLMMVDIPSKVNESAGLQAYHVNILWGYLWGLKKPRTHEYNFDLLWRL